MRNKCRKITIKLGREGEKEIEKGVEKNKKRVRIVNRMLREKNVEQ